MSSEFRLVPYSHQSLNCRRQENFSHFLATGGRIRPMVFGAPAPANDIDSESGNLLDPTSKLVRDYQVAQRTTRMLMIVVAFTLIAATGTFVALGATVWRVKTEITSMHSSIAPHAEVVINSTLQMLADTKDTLHNLNSVSTSGTQLTAASMPKIMTMANNSVSITDRINELLKHPTVQVSLGG